MAMKLVLKAAWIRPTAVPIRGAMDIPVFHDDQHGTAIVVLAGIINALKVVGKTKSTVCAVINGGGAAGLSIARLLLAYGLDDLVICDINGAIYDGADGLNPAQAAMAKLTNKGCEKGELKDIIKGKDIFIGVSRGNVVSSDMIASMPMAEFLHSGSQRIRSAASTRKGGSSMKGKLWHCCSASGIILTAPLRAARRRRRRRTSDCLYPCHPCRSWRASVTVMTRSRSWMRHSSFMNESLRRIPVRTVNTCR